MIKRIDSLPVQLIFILLLITAGCRQPDSGNPGDITGDLIIFHAGSLAVPFKAMADSFKLLHPGVTIKAESAGSLACIRKITDLNSPCDILASADYSLIDKLMIPDHAAWNVQFAGNEMALVYRPESLKANQLTKDNWSEILLSPDVRFGRSDPDSDPCGYRTILSLKLAEKIYRHPGLTEKFLHKDERFMRPKEVDLLALLESGTIDYIFIYKSVAIQHRLLFLELPDSINLGNPELSDFYGEVSLKVAGNKPGESITQAGEPMVYGVTVPKNSPNLLAAKAFMHYLLTDGLKIMDQMGQTPIILPVANNRNRMPEELKPLTR